MWVAMDKVHRVEVARILFLACVFVSKNHDKNENKKILKYPIVLKICVYLQKKLHVKNDHTS